VELRDHPWFVASQFHPEFRSRPDRPHPLFDGFVETALALREGREPVLRARLTTPAQPASDLHQAADSGVAGTSGTGELDLSGAHEA